MVSEKILQLENRRKIYLYIKKHPGTYLRELQKVFKLPIGVLEHHLYYMVKKEILKLWSDGYRTRYFVAEDVRYRDVMYLSILRQRTLRRILIYLILNPDSTFKDILKNFNMTKSALSFHLKKLTKAGIIINRKRCRESIYSVKDVEQISKLLITYKSSFVDDAVDRFVDAWLEL